MFYLPLTIYALTPSLAFVCTLYLTWALWKLIAPINESKLLGLTWVQSALKKNKNIIKYSCLQFDSFCEGSLICVSEGLWSWGVCFLDDAQSSWNRVMSFEELWSVESLWHTTPIQTGNQGWDMITFSAGFFEKAFIPHYQTATDGSV